MSIQSEKLKLIEWLTGIEDASIIEKIKLLKSNPDISSDCWNVISGVYAGKLVRRLK